MRPSTVGATTPPSRRDLRCDLPQRQHGLLIDVIGFRGKRYNKRACAIRVFWSGWRLRTGWAHGDVTPQSPGGEGPNGPTARAPKTAVRRNNSGVGTYDALQRRLSSAPAEQVTLTFAEMDAPVDGLPVSAATLRPFWGNEPDTRRRPQAKAWQQAGRLVEEVELGAVGALFRAEPGGRGRTLPTSAASARESATPAYLSC
jgi:hypothetical protein